jgi:hypothetical protein
MFNRVLKSLLALQLSALPWEKLLPRTIDRSSYLACRFSFCANSSNSASSCFQWNIDLRLVPGAHATYIISRLLTTVPFEPIYVVIVVFEVAIAAMAVLIMIIPSFCIMIDKFGTFGGDLARCLRKE